MKKSKVIKEFNNKAIFLNKTKIESNNCNDSLFSPNTDKVFETEAIVNNERIRQKSFNSNIIVILNILIVLARDKNKVS